MGDGQAYDVFTSYRHQDPDGPWVRQRLVPGAGGRGYRLAVADAGPEIILWDLVDTTAWRRSLCQMLDRGFSDQERRRFLPDSRVPETCPG
jgi:hypothetical protein